MVYRTLYHIQIVELHKRDSPRVTEAFGLIWGLIY